MVASGCAGRRFLQGSLSERREKFKQSTPAENRSRSGRLLQVRPELRGSRPARAARRICCASTPPSHALSRGRVRRSFRRSRSARLPRSPCRRARRPSTMPCRQPRSTARRRCRSFSRHPRLRRVRRARLLPRTVMLRRQPDCRARARSSTTTSRSTSISTSRSTVTKTTPLVHVSRGQLVPYIIHGGERHRRQPARRHDRRSLPGRLPLRRRLGAARRRAAASRSIAGRELSWTRPDGHARQPARAEAAARRRLRRGRRRVRESRAGVQRASRAARRRPRRERACASFPIPRSTAPTSSARSSTTTNRNGLQDEGETGIPGVRLATARGLLATTDQFGRFHITCAITPHEGRGSNFVLKLDDRTLPSGYRGSTGSLQVQRATRGKMLEFSFGASIHRVIGLDLADADVRDGLRSRSASSGGRGSSLLLEELRAAPAVLRLSYLADRRGSAARRRARRRRCAGRSRRPGRRRAKPAAYELRDRARGLLAARRADRRARATQGNRE